MNLAPSFRSQRLVVIFLIAELFIPLAHSSRGGAGSHSEGRHCPLLDLHKAGTGSASLPNPSLCLPCLHHFSALMNHGNLMGRVW